MSLEPIHRLIGHSAVSGSESSKSQFRTHSVSAASAAAPTKHPRQLPGTTARTHTGAPAGGGHSSDRFESALPWSVRTCAPASACPAEFFRRGGLRLPHQTPGATPAVVDTKAPLSPVAKALMDSIAAGRTCFHIDAGCRDTVLAELGELVHLPAGLKLIQLVVKYVRHLDIVTDDKTSPHTHTQTNGHNGSQDLQAAIIELGTKEIRIYDRAHKLHSIPPYLVLAHEIVHAYHGARWPDLEETLFAEEIPNYTNLEEYASIEGFNAEEARRLSRSTRGQVDAQTFQLYGAVSENELRRQAGLVERFGHDGVEGNPDHDRRGQSRRRPPIDFAPDDMWQVLMGGFGGQLRPFPN